MFIDHMSLAHNLENYKSPRARITRMIKAGEVIQLRRNVFIYPDSNYSLKSLASVIYGPSYISFEYALAFYGLIPERVNLITSAVYNKNKNKRFHTPVGDFHYYYLPREVYPYGVIRQEENAQGYLIASPEKALLDTLYKVRGISTISGLKYLLFQDWRMEESSVSKLDREFINSLAPKYRNKLVSRFMLWLDREAHA